MGVATIYVLGSGTARNIVRNIYRLRNGESMNSEKTKWSISFEVNGGESIGKITVNATSVERIDETMVVADGVVIDLDPENTRFQIVGLPTKDNNG